MSSTTLQRRDFMREVLSHARRDGAAVAPWRGPSAQGGAATLDGNFDDEGDLLVELHREWLRLLVGRLHGGEIVARRTMGEVRALYAELCDDHPTLRRLLDAHCAEPALAAATLREHAMLARIAGLVPEGMSLEEAARLGRALVTPGIPVQRSART